MADKSVECFFSKDKILIEMIKKCENWDSLDLKIKVLLIFRLYQKSTPLICLILHQFNLYILLMCEKKLVTIKHFLRTHLKP